MLPNQYIKLELEKFILEFPKTSVRYDNDTNSNTHTLEIVPNEIYHLDGDYINWESIFFDDFTNQFPDQNICFISDDAIVGLEKIDFELSGKEFISINTMIPTSFNFKTSSNISINKIQINSNEFIKNEISKAKISSEPTISIDLTTNLIPNKINIIENILNQHNYTLAA